MLDFERLTTPETCCFTVIVTFLVRFAFDLYVPVTVTDAAVSSDATVSSPFASILVSAELFPETLQFTSVEGPYYSRVLILG